MTRAAIPDVKPHHCPFLSSLPAAVSGTIEGPATDSPLAQKPVVVALDQMCLNLAHGIENHAYNDEKTGTAEKLRGDLWNVQSLTKQNSKNRDHVRKMAPAKVSRVMVKSKNLRRRFPDARPGCNRRISSHHLRSGTAEIGSRPRK